MSNSSSSSQSTGLPVNFWTSDLRKFIGLSCLASFRAKSRNPGLRRSTILGVLRLRCASLRMTTDHALCRFVAFLRRSFAQRAGEIILHSIENPIHEASRVRPAKSFRQLDRFVDGNHRRDVVAKKHFENREPENVPIHRGDATEIVIFAILPDAIIDLGQMRHHAVDEWLGELAHSRFGRTKIPEVFHAFRRAITMEITPEMKLNCRLPGGAPLSHNNYLRRKPRMTSAIWTAARAASAPRLIFDPRQRSRACASVSMLRTALMTGTPCSSAICCSASVTERARFCA